MLGAGTQHRCVRRRAQNTVPNDGASWLTIRAPHTTRSRSNSSDRKDGVADEKPPPDPPSPTHLSGGDTDSAAIHPAGRHRFGLPERPKALGAARFLLRDYDWPQLPFRSPLRGPWLTSVFGAVLLASLPIVIITGLLSWVAYGPRFGQSRPGTWVGCTCRCSTGRPGRRGCTG